MGGELNEVFPHIQADMHTPEVVVHVEDFLPPMSTPIPPPAPADCRWGRGDRPSPALWRDRQPRGLLDDGQAGAGSGDGPLFSVIPTPPPEAKEKVLELARLLTPWCGRLTVHVVPFTEIQEELRRSCPESLFTLLMRRFMMRIAQRVAQRVGAHGLVTGESLGQVASQTMEAMAVTGQVVSPHLPARGGHGQGRDCPDRPENRHL